MLEEKPKTYTGKEVDEARHHGYKLAEDLYSPQIKQLKQTIKKLKESYEDTIKKAVMEKI
jgi:hypothetical protein